MQKDIQKVLAEKGLSPSEVDLKDLHLRQFVNEGSALPEVEFAARFLAKVCGQTVTTAKVALSGDLPSDVDRCPEPRATQPRNHRSDLW
jgi:hypothetical protein